MSDVHQLLTTQELATALGVDPTTLPQWRLVAGRGPRFIKVGAAVRYRRSDVEKWLTDQTRAGTRTDDES